MATLNRSTISEVGFHGDGSMINGKPVRNFDNGWKALAKRLGLDGLLFHDLRRTGVRDLVRAGVPETVADENQRAQDALSV